MSATQVAVIIVNWKVRDLLRECILSLKTDSGWSWNSFEVVVVDNDSNDGSLQMLAEEFPEVRAIANAQNVGFGAANNQAFAMTSADTIVLLNPDTVVLPGALRQLVEALWSEPSLGAVGCRLLNRDRTLQRWTAGAFPGLCNVTSHYLFIDRLLPRSLRPAPLYLDHDVPEPIDVGWVSGACMALRREAIADTLFDPRFFMYAEDMELCHRLNARGWKVRYDPRMSIVHYQGASLQKQSAEIMLSSLKGPHDFFTHSHGRLQTMVFDAVTVLGFLLRWAINAVAAVFTPEPYRSRARSSRRYLQLALKMIGRPMPK